MRRGLARHLTVATAASVAVVGPSTFTAEAGDSAEEVEAKLVRSTYTSKFDPPSPDPAGITYRPENDRLFISDSEVNEMSSYEGHNLFRITRTGKKTGNRSTTSFSVEPTGVAYDPGANRMFFTDDDADEVHVVKWGRDRQFGTEDDAVTSFSTRAAGNKDPEGITYDVDRGHLLVVDGSGATVYRYQPGDNGRFDGVKDGDDKVRTFDVEEVGAKEPEGIAHHSARNSILVLDHKTQRIYEVSSTGTLLNIIGISAAKPVVPAGLALAPAGDGSEKTNLYIVDRGVDNDREPEENDGRMYEMSVSLPPRY